ncbi:MAG: thiosulfate oxidation carrier complex protein SoxZ [Gammaproteobacteria bacterium]
MTSSIRIRTDYHNGTTTVRSIIRHPMETGLVRSRETGELVPAHFIKEVICRHGDDVVLRCNWGRAVSKNPYLSFKFSGAKPGDMIRINWSDNKGNTDAAEAVIQ